MKFQHKGYTLSQTDYNYHYRIFAPDGHMVLHVPHDKPITEEKAREFIDNYISFVGTLDKVSDDFWENDENEV